VRPVRLALPAQQVRRDWPVRKVLSVLQVRLVRPALSARPARPVHKVLSARPVRLAQLVLSVRPALKVLSVRLAPKVLSVRLAPKALPALTLSLRPLRLWQTPLLKPNCSPSSICFWPICVQQDCWNLNPFIHAKTGTAQAAPVHCVYSFFLSQMRIDANIASSPSSRS